MKIGVKYTESWEAITVQGGWWNHGYFEVDWCNHDGATEDTVTETSYNQRTEDIEDTEYEILICDKCEAVNSGDGWELI